MIENKITIRDERRVNLGGIAKREVLQDDGSVQKIEVDARNIVIPDSWDDVSKIPIRRGVDITTPADLVLYIELPLLRACQHLMLYGLQTTESNAHFERTEKPSEYDVTNITLTITKESIVQQGKLNNANELVVKNPLVWKWVSADGVDMLSMNWRIYRSYSPVQVSSTVFKWATELTSRKA